jgi:hypothetical protein
LFPSTKIERRFIEESDIEFLDLRFLAEILTKEFKLNDLLRSLWGRKSPEESNPGYPSKNQNRK